MSKQDMADSMDLTRQAVIEIVQRLELKGIIERNVTDGLRTLPVWSETVDWCKESLQVGADCKESLQDCKESLQVGVKKDDSKCKDSLHNIYKQVDRNKEIDKESSFFLLSQFLKEKINKNYPKIILNDSQLIKWSRDFRLMIEKDGRNMEEIKKVITWVHEDSDFWYKNILSASKLREKFGRLYGEMEAKDKKKSLVKREGALHYEVKKRPVNI